MTVLHGQIAKLDDKLAVDYDLFLKINIIGRTLDMTVIYGQLALKATSHNDQKNNIAN